MLKSCNELKYQGCSKTWIWKSSMWPAVMACRKIAKKIDVDVDITITTNTYACIQIIHFYQK